MSGTSYYKRNRDVILNRAKDYYEDDKELLRERRKNKYRELSDEEKNIKREYGRNRYHNMSEEKKQRLKKYQRNYREAKKTSFIDVKNLLIVLSKKIHIVIKVHFKVAITKIFFLVLLTIMKDKTVF